MWAFAFWYKKRTQGKITNYMAPSLIVVSCGNDTSNAVDDCYIPFLM
jgi:hypothetical protein